jgi:transposase-like protein
MDNDTSAPGATKPRRRYTRAFKLQVLTEARQPGESLAAVAVRHGLNPNMVHKWRKTLQRSAQNEFLRLPAPTPNAQTASIASSSAGQHDTIRMEVPTPQGQLVVHWPVRQLPESIAWLQALTR